MERFDVEIIETYKYQLPFEANNKQEAIEKAKDYYKNNYDNYIGVASATTFDNVKFKCR